MRLTPKFNIDQTDDQLILKVNVPYTKLSNLEYEIVDQHICIITLKPYYLKLVLPGNVICKEVKKLVEIVDQQQENKLPKVDFDFDLDNGTVFLTLFKKNSGEHFKNLNMISLLSENNSTSKNDDELADSIEALNINFNKKKPMIEVISSTVEIEEEDETIMCTYGFLRSFSGILNSELLEIFDLIELKDPDNVPINKRQEIREKEEDDTFDKERFLGDLFLIADDEIYLTLLKRKPFEKILENKNFTGEENVELIEMPQLEKTLKKLKHQEKQSKMNVGIVLDLLLSFAYEQRLTGGDSNVESGWSIKTLSPILCYLDDFHKGDLDTVVKSFCHRVLCKPYIRRWDLAILCIQDVLYLLSCDENQNVYIIRCLMEIRKILRIHNNNGILNQLYIEPLIIWMQQENSFNAKEVTKFLSEWLNKYSKKYQDIIRFDLNAIIQQAMEEEE